MFLHRVNRHLHAQKDPFRRPLGRWNKPRKHWKICQVSKHIRGSHSSTVHSNLLLPSCKLAVYLQISPDVLEVPSLVDTRHNEKKCETDSIPWQTSIILVQLAVTFVIIYTHICTGFHTTLLKSSVKYNHVLLMCVHSQITEHPNSSITKLAGLSSLPSYTVAWRLSCSICHADNFKKMAFEVLTSLFQNDCLLVLSLASRQFCQ